MGRTTARRTTPRRAPSLAMLAIASLLAAACSGGGDVGDAAGRPGARASTPAAATPSRQATSTPPPSPTSAPPSAPAGPPADARVEVAATLAEGLDAPWGLAVLPDGAALVSQRDAATVVRVERGGDVTEVGEVPGVEPGGEGGLLGLALSPGFATDGLVYAYLTGDDGNEIVRMRYDGRLGEPEPVLDGIEKAGNHNGGRMVFGPDGMLYIGTGDAGDPDASQDPDSLNGKILRVTPDGEPAPGNPDPSSPVLSLGHRNVQGLAFDGQGRLWAAEFGQNTWDELNLVEAGANYGWPEVEGREGEEGFVDPIEQWRTDEASPSGIAVAGDAVYMAGLRGERLWQIPTAGGDPRAHLEGDFGRLRTVESAPDGSLWLLTSNTDGRGDPEDTDDRLLRVTLT